MVRRVLQKVHNIRLAILFFINLIMFFTMFGLFVFHKHFSTDDYYAYQSQYAVAIEVTAFSYRNCLGFLYFILDKLHINVVENQIVFGCLLIAAFSWCITVIVHKLNKMINIKNRIDTLCILELGAIILLANAFVSEWLWFSLSYVQWIFSVLASVYGAIVITRNKNHVKNWFLCLLYLFIAAGNYQILLADYVYLVMFFIYVDMKGKLKKESIWLMVRAAVPAVISIVLNIALTNLISTFGIVPAGVGRMKLTFLELRKRLWEIIIFQKELWINGMGLLPKYSAFICLLVLIVILFLVSYKKASFITYLYIFLIVVSGQSVMYMAQIMSGTGMSARILVPIYGIYAVLLWLICYYVSSESKKHTVCRNLAGGLFAVFLLANIVSIYSNTVDAVKTNAIDQFYIDEILAKIDDHEQRQKVKILSVGFCHDANLTYKYYDYINNKDYHNALAMRAFSTDWSDYTSLCFYSNRKLARIDVPEEIKDAFACQDWSAPDLEKQIIFDEDKVYICIY